MDQKQKINYLIENCYEDFILARHKAIKICDEKYSMFCPCGRLATGLHTSRCASFNKEVEKTILELLKDKF